MTHDKGPRRAVFLDRDGTLNREVDYLHRAENFAWIPGALTAVHRLNEAGLLAIVVTNQSGVARGYYDEEAVRRLHRHMQRQLAQHDARIDAFYYSPYHADGIIEPYARKSSCRKPGTDLFEQALQKWAIDPDRSFVVGDKNTDLEPGNALGMTTILVETGYGPDERAATPADYVDPDVGAAVQRILRLCAAEPA